MNELCPMPGCRVDAVTPADPARLLVATHGTRPGGRCPDCGCTSRAVHSRYHRHPADLPSFGHQVGIALRVRRFYCHNAHCSRRTFAERLPQLVAPYARRTIRLGEVQGRVGAALGGEAGARLLRHLAMPASPDTVQRLTLRLPLPEMETPRVVAIDDRAISRGRACGTIVVDLERRRVVDLLADRTSTTVSAWLRQQPGVEVVARDRSTEYARAAAIGAPAAMQVADRWHLLANMRQALQRWLHGVHDRLRCLPVSSVEGEGGTAPSPCSRQEAFRRTGPERAARAASRARWQVRYEEVRHRHLAGQPLMAIARTMGLARGTVRKLAFAEAFPVRLPHGPGPSILDPFLPHLEQRLTDGCENGLALWRELRGQGFPGGSKQVHRWLAERRTVPAKVGRPRKQVPSDVGPAPADSRVPLLPGARQLAWLLVQPTAALGAADAATVSRVEQDKDVKAVAALARRFTALVRTCGVKGRQDGNAPAEPAAELHTWLVAARTCGVSAIETFAAGLDADGDALRAALTRPWSSGQAEGQINRLKLLKRQSYGRASFGLLRQRVLMAA